MKRNKIVGLSWALFLKAGLLLLAACSGKNTTEEQQRLVVVLDYLPGPIHAGFYAAQARGDYAQAGLEVEFQTPASTSDTIRLMAAGKADLGMAPLIDFFHLKSEGRPFRLLMAVVQTPLNSVITSEKSAIRRPKDLEGKLAATTGIVGDEFTLKALVKADGGDPDKVETIGVGFNTIQALSSGQVDAAFGFWNSEGVQYAKTHPAVVLRSYEHGLPAYPEIVVFGHEDQLVKKREAIEAFIKITVASYERLLQDPEEALSLFAESVDGYDIESARPYYEALLPVFKYQASQYGTIDTKEVVSIMDWLAEHGLPQYKHPLVSLVDETLTLQTP